MVISQVGIDLIKGFESFRAQPYNDADTPPNSTIGYGTLLHKGPVDFQHNELDKQYINGITEFTAEQMLLEHVRCEVAPLISKWVKCAISQNQYDALASFLYDVGPQAFTNPDGSLTGLRRALLNHDLDQVPGEFKKWTHSGGRQLLGLVFRREKESELWRA